MTLKKKKVMFVFGTRPEAIKMAPVVNILKKESEFFEPVVVVTAQHRHMLDQVLSLFKIKSDYDLGIMEEGQSLSTIAIKVLKGLDPILEKEVPDILLVQGDTSSAFVAALSAFYHRLAVGHIEAGLRTGNKYNPFPEEINRRLVGAAADLHFPPTETAKQNLLKEGVSEKNIFVTGNTVIDALLEVARSEDSLYKTKLKLSPAKKMILVTTHRRESFGGPMEESCQAIKEIALKHFQNVEVVLPVHRNPKVSGPVKKILGKIDNVKLVEPVDYGPFVHLMQRAYIILTDSGGIQEEAPSLGKPVLVLRETTERPEAVDAGAVKLVGTNRKTIVSEVEILLRNKKEYDRMSKAVNPYGDGKATLRIIQALKYFFGFSKDKPAAFEASGEAGPK